MGQYLEDPLLQFRLFPRASVLCLSSGRESSSFRLNEGVHRYDASIAPSKSVKALDSAISPITKVGRAPNSSTLLRTVPSILLCIRYAPTVHRHHLARYLLAESIPRPRRAAVGREERPQGHSLRTDHTTCLNGPSHISAFPMYSDSCLGTLTLIDCCSSMF